MELLLETSYSEYFRIVLKGTALFLWEKNGVGIKRYNHSRQLLRKMSDLY